MGRFSWDPRESERLGGKISKSETKTSDIRNFAFLACIKVIKAQSDRRESPELSSPRKRQIRPLLVKKIALLCLWAAGHPR